METKEKIIKMSLKLFMEIGFMEVSIRDLLKEVGLNKDVFYNHFKSKDELICEAIKEFFQCFDDCFEADNKFNESSEKKLFRIFQKYSTVERNLKTKFNIKKIQYRSLASLMIEGVSEYKFMTKSIIDFNSRLLQRVEFIIEEGKNLGEVSKELDSKLVAANVISTLHSSTVLWSMNQRVDIKRLFETDFKYLWNTIKSS